jgi:hypothetical protein
MKLTPQRRAASEHCWMGLAAGLWSRCVVASAIPGDVLRGFIALVNEDLDTTHQPRPSEDRDDVLRGMAAGLLDLAESSPLPAT